jgi:hypothetical protein
MALVRLVTRRKTMAAEQAIVAARGSVSRCSALLRRIPPTSGPAAQ